MQPLIGRGDRVLEFVLRTAALAAASIVLLIVAFLLLGSADALARVGPVRFLSDERWLPRDGGPDGEFGLVPMLWASAAVAVGGVLVAAPLGILSAVFSVHYTPRRLGRVYDRMVEVLAGIPSVVFGLWGLVTLVPLVRAVRPPGPSLAAGILVLSVMILPTIALLARAALTAVPQAHLQGAAALGLSRWTTLARIVLPSARAGLGVAVLLGALRAVGETMAVLMVCGNVPQLSADPFQPVRTLTANIALELGYATQAHRSTLFVSGLLLMALVLALLFAQERLRRGLRRG